MEKSSRELKNNIEIFRKKILEYKNALDNVLENVEIYYQISNDYFNNYNSKNRNYEILKGYNEIISQNTNIIKYIQEIVNGNNFENIL